MMHNNNGFFLAAKHFRSSLLFTLMVLLCACSTSVPTPVPKAMPHSDAAPVFKEDEHGLFLMTATIRNDLAPDYQPDALFVRILKKQPSEKPQLLRFNVLPADHVGNSGRKAGKTYLLRFQMEPGSYRVLGINVSAGEFPVRGFGFMPIHADFTVPVGGNFYLGNVFGINRERRENEYRTGPLTPQIDQSITGLSNGTFDVSIRDRFEQDLPLYRLRFPEVEALVIDKAILPPIDRQRAQTYWEEQ